MKANDKAKEIMLFCRGLIAVGGAERLLFEEAKYFKNSGYNVKIITLDFDKSVLFDNSYKFEVNQIVNDIKRPIICKNKFLDLIMAVIALRKEIRRIKPELILLSNAYDCIYFYLATLGTDYIYSTHVHGTIFWFSDQLKYSYIHKNVFEKIRNSVIGHKQFIPETIPKISFIKRIQTEFAAILMYIGIRNAQQIFVLSNQMKWEVNVLYGKDAIVAKGAYSEDILNYKTKKDIKYILNLKNKRLLLNINRLDPRKRIDILIKAFKVIHNEYNDVILAIGGTGPEEEKLKLLVKELSLNDSIIFLGYIKETDLMDYICACDIFIHPNWADFAIAPYEALALQKKVIWSSEMEIDKELTSNAHIFSANPDIDGISMAIINALNTKIDESTDMSMYTWNKYCAKILKYLEEDPYKPTHR